MENKRIDLLTPNAIDIEERGPYNSIVTLQPLERGFGQTLGNSLRRILLSVMPGAAVTEVCIEGIEQEYSTIKGVHEDVINIIMNLNQLAVKLDDDINDVVVTYRASDRIGALKAGQHEPVPGVTVMNPEHVICSLTDSNASIVIHVRIQTGSGYSKASDRREAGVEQKINILGSKTILTDALFAPVNRVNYEVSTARHGQSTDYDKLIIELETDGTIEPKSAIRRAATILQHQIAPFVNLEAIKVSSEPVESKPQYDPVLTQSIDRLNLTVRAANCLKNNNIRLIGDLVTKTEVDLLRFSNLGRKSLCEIKDELKKLGLDLGRSIPDWVPSGPSDL